MAPEIVPREFLLELVLEPRPLLHIVVLNAINLPAVAFKGTDRAQSQAIFAGILGTPLEEAAAAAATSEETVAQAQSPLLAGVGTVVELVVVTEDSVDVETGDV
jgi:hypothetical protein